MTLEQLMAFSVTAEHARQEQVWENVNRSGYDEPYQIRRMLTEAAVRASDKRARFVGLDAYEPAGGSVLRDLFEHDGGGWLQDVALLERLVTEKLTAEAETIAEEGWKWISVAVDFPTATISGLRRLEGKPADLTSEEQASSTRSRRSRTSFRLDYQDADELPDEVDARLGEIEEALMAFEERPDVLIRPKSSMPAPSSASIAKDGSRSTGAMSAGGRDRVVATIRNSDRARHVDAEGQETGAAVQRATITVAGQAGDRRG